MTNRFGTHYRYSAAHFGDSQLQVMSNRVFFVACDIYICFPVGIHECTVAYCLPNAYAPLHVSGVYSI